VSEPGNDGYTGRISPSGGRLILCGRSSTQEEKLKQEIELLKAKIAELTGKSQDSDSILWSNFFTLNKLILLFNRIAPDISIQLSIRCRMISETASCMYHFGRPV
jgi:hypothetical protein